MKRFLGDMSLRLIARRAVLVLLLLLPVASCQNVPELLTEVHLQAKFRIPNLIEGHSRSHVEMKYLLYLPEGYGQDPDKRWPLIIYLHGAGGSDNNSAFVMGQGLPAVLYLKEQPADWQFVVVSPQAFPNTPWWTEDTPAILIALLDEVIDAYLVDPDRVYLTGYSMGGYGSWYLATEYPHRFAAMVSVSGSGYRIPPPPPEDLVCQMKDVPVWAIHGEEDLISAPLASKMNAMALTSCGGEAEWTQYPGVGHHGASAQAYRDPELYRWMLEHVKPQS